MVSNPKLELYVYSLLKWGQQLEFKSRIRLPISNGRCSLTCYQQIVGVRGVMISVAGYGHGDTSSNPGPD